MKASRAIAVIAAITVAVITLGVVSVVDAEPASAPSAPTIETIMESTTTTTLEVDLSWLNTTTTTQVARAVTEYRNDKPVAVGTTTDRWDQLAQCETGGNWATNTGNGFGGGLQFMHGNGYSTWLSFGGSEFSAHPWDATRDEQIVIAERVLTRTGWRAWPGCSRRFGWS